MLKAVSAKWTLAVAATIAVMAAAGCKPAPHANATTSTPAEAVLKVGSQRGSTKALLLASHALDGAPYRIEWSEFPAAAHLLEALSAGAVDTGSVGDAPFMFAYAAGSKIKVAQVYRSGGDGSAVSIIVPKNSPLKSAADLRGKRIATGRGSIGHYLLLRVLEKEGIRPDEVKVVFLDPAGGKAALSTGAVDAWSTWGPYVSIAKLRDGSRALVSGAGLVNSIGFQAATDGAIAAKHAVLLDFMTRLSRAQRWANVHHDQYAAIMSKETGLPLDIAQYTIKSQGALTPTPIDETIVQYERRTLDHFRAAGAIAATPDVVKALDASFNDAVKP